MLRITRVEEGTMKLEGTVAGPWVAELSRTLGVELLRGPPVILDLGGVTFADAAGAALLRGARRRDVELRNASPFMRQLLEEPAR